MKHLVSFGLALVFAASFHTVSKEPSVQFPCGTQTVYRWETIQLHDLVYRGETVDPYYIEKEIRVYPIENNESNR